jgi:hypothetical protein
MTEESLNQSRSADLRSAYRKSEADGTVVYEIDLSGPENRIVGHYLMSATGVRTELSVAPFRSLGS